MVDTVKQDYVYCLLAELSIQKWLIKAIPAMPGSLYDPQNALVGYVSDKVVHCDHLVRHHAKYILHLL